MLLLSAIPASAAQAAVRNAVAQGGATTGDCIATPCTFPQALAAAVDGDEVLVQPGDYSLAPFAVNKRLFIHGVEDQPRPRLIDSVGGVGRFISLDRDGTRMRNLYVESNATNHTIASIRNVTLERLEVVVGGGSAFNAVLLELASPVIRDTVLRSSSGNALTLQATTNAQLRNVTAHASGANRTAITVAAHDYNEAITPCDTSLAGSATARNVIARGGQYDILVISTCSKAATLNIRNSNYRPSHVLLSGGAMATLNDGGAAGGNQSADPLFAGAATGDLHLLPGSPAIDAGIADALNGTADLDGDARPQGAAIDIGADEFVPPAPPPDGGGGDGDGGGGGGDETGEPPSNQFAFGKLRRNKRLGIASLTVKVPGPGRLDLARTKKLRADAEAAAAGAEKLSVVPKARVLRKLERRGKATVSVSVTYVPDGGEPNTIVRKIKLVKR